MAIIEKRANLNQTTWAVKCDKCGQESKKPAWEPGDADTFARKDGFGPVFICAEEPGKWYCPECLVKMQAKPAN